ncbi:MAG: RidA family protein [Verrucomicrobiota bacterium]|nr:RidA family protein [Verrucomicrobiota bacterium]
MDIEERLFKLGIQLPSAPLPAGNYQPALKIGQLLFLSGAICCVDGTMTHSGKIGATRDIAYGKAAARVCALNLLTIAQQALGDLNQVKQVLQLNGFVNAIPGFSESPDIINGASDLIVEVFGERGRHTRAAVAVTGLPKDSTVEIQAIFAAK